MREKKWKTSYIIIPFLLGSVLAGCGVNLNGIEGLIDVSGGQGNVSENLSGNKEQLEQLELKYSRGELQTAEYVTLAQLYVQNGEVRRGRDLLEQSVRLNQDQAALEALSAIVVNVEEEASDVQEQMKQLKQNLELEEYLDEGINMLDMEHWFPIMMPKLLEGSRSYYLEDEALADTLTVTVGYDENQTKYTDVWYTNQDGQLLYIRRQENMVRLMTAEIDQGRYQGDFDSWLCMSDTGAVYHEQGTFQQGIMVGTYTAMVYQPENEVATDLYSLWCNRESFEMVSYRGNFDEQGRTTLSQLYTDEWTSSGEITADYRYIIYAYDEQEKNFLFLRVAKEQKAESYAFSGESFQMTTALDYTAYEIRQLEEDSTEGSTTGAASSVQDTVRIYDGNIEYFDGEKWCTLGTVESFQEQDPFYVDSNEATSETEENETTAQGASSSYTYGGVGTVSTYAPSPSASATVKPTNTTKPAATKAPTATKTPAATTTPVTATPTPQAPSNNTPTPSTPEPATPAPQTPTPAPIETQVPDSAGGNETEGEWSPDIE